MLTSRRLDTLERLALLAVALVFPTLAGAHIAEFEATLDVAQEVPAPVGTDPGAGGTGEFTLEDDGTMQAMVTFQGLSGPALLAHIHQGPAGVAGPIVAGYTVPQPVGSAGTISGVGAAPFATEEQQQTLFAGGMYFNIHTQQNLSGEIRGQIFLKPGPCPCTGATSPKQFKQCVKQQIKGVEKAERQEEEVKQLKRLFKKAACGKTTTPRKKVACCLPIAPAQNIVTDRMCAAIKERQCTNLGGTSLGLGVPCSPNPCAASPSGAFVEAPAS